MRIAIRADASDLIGTGHVMRQIALAQNLLNDNHEVTLFASITGPDWLRKYSKSQSGLVWVEVQEGDFSAGPLLAGGVWDALVVDAYTLNQKALELLEKAIPTVAVIVDGPWQDVAGKLGIAPTLGRNPSWVSEYRERFDGFYWGPEFFMLRREVIDLSAERAKRKSNSEPQIVVALGGSDFGGKTKAVMRALSEIGLPAKVDVFVKDPKSWEAFPAHAGQSVEFHEPGVEFLEYLANADLAVTAAGTAVAEISFLGADAVLIPVVANQEENAKALRDLKVGAVLDSDQADFPAQLVELVREALLSPTAHPQGLIDSNGAERVAEILSSSIRSKLKM